jgi:hypothetical protein
MDNVTLIRFVSGMLALSVFLLPLYVLPTILAWKKTHRTPILLLNLLLGWTLLGWIGALDYHPCASTPLRAGSRCRTLPDAHTKVFQQLLALPKNHFASS